MLRDDRTVKATRAIQVVLILLAALAGLAMAEQTATTRTLGSESLAITVDAPVENPRGPWSAGESFTEASAGIPFDVAPVWNVTATHQGSGVDAEGHAWSASLIVRERGAEGGDWWRETEELPVQASGPTARIAFDANATLSRARQLDAEADVPGTLEIRIVVRHHGDLVVAGQDRSTVTVASLTAVPDGDRMTLGTDDDGTTFAETEEAGLSPLPFLLAGAAAVLEIVPWRARRDRRTWEDPSVETVRVDGLSVPADVPRTELGRLLTVAKRQDGIVLVDVGAGIALLRGPPDLWARLEPDEIEVESGTADEEDTDSFTDRLKAKLPTGGRDEEDDRSLLDDLIRR